MKNVQVPLQAEIKTQLERLARQVGKTTGDFIAQVLDDWLIQKRPPDLPAVREVTTTEWLADRFHVQWPHFSEAQQRILVALVEHPEANDTELASYAQVTTRTVGRLRGHPLFNEVMDAIFDQSLQAKMLQALDEVSEMAFDREHKSQFSSLRMLLQLGNKFTNRVQIEDKRELYPITEPYKSLTPEEAVQKFIERGYQLKILPDQYAAAFQKVHEEKKGIRYADHIETTV